MSSCIARVDTLEVGIRNNEGSKLRLGGVLAAKRAQRHDEPSALSRGGVGGSQAEGHEFRKPDGGRAEQDSRRYAVE